MLLFFLSRSDFSILLLILSDHDIPVRYFLFLYHKIGTEPYQLCNYKVLILARGLKCQVPQMSQGWVQIPNKICVPYIKNPNKFLMLWVLTADWHLDTLKEKVLVILLKKPGRQYIYKLMACNHFPVILLYIMKQQGDAGFVTKEKQILLFHKKGNLLGFFYSGPQYRML